MLLLIVYRGLSQGPSKSKNFCKVFSFSKNFSHGGGVLECSGADTLFSLIRVFAWEGERQAGRRGAACMPSLASGPCATSWPRERRCAVCIPRPLEHP